MISSKHPEVLQTIDVNDKGGHFISMIKNAKLRISNHSYPKRNKTNDRCYGVRNYEKDCII